MDNSDNIRTYLEDASRRLGLKPSTVGRQAGQGGRFYRRLCVGKRVWPDTEAKVRANVQAMLAASGSADK